MIILGLDFETTGLDPEKDKITEVGLVLWDTEMQRVIASNSFLVACGVELPKDLEEMTHLNLRLIAGFGRAQENARSRIIYMAQQADRLMTFNGEDFDLKFLSKLPQAQNAVYTAFPVNLLETHIDAYYSIPWPRSQGSPSLSIVGMNHGYLNPAPHSALGDVLTMKAVVEKYDINLIDKIAQTPRRILIAEPRQEEDVERLKKAGFKWNRDVPDEWSLKVKMGMMAHFKEWYDEKLCFPWCFAGTHRVKIRAVNLPFEQKDLAKERFYRWDGDRKMWYKLVSPQALECERQECHGKFKIEEVRE